MEVGIKFRNIYMLEYDFEILSIDKENNTAKVKIIPMDAKRFSWEEDWNLLHTQWGFERGEYHLGGISKLDTPILSEEDVKGLNNDR